MNANSAPKEALATSGSAEMDDRVFAPPEFDIRAGQAITRGDAQLLQSFIGQGLDPNAWISGKGAKRNMVCTSVAADQAQCLEVLLNAGADLAAANQVSTTQWASLLELAVMRQCEPVARVLVAAGHDVNVKTNKKDNNLAHFSSGQGSMKMLALLTEIGVDLQHANADGDTPLHMAIFNGACIAWLANQAPATLNARNKEGRTPLIEAIRWNKLDAALELLDFDQDLSIEDAKGQDARWWARFKKMDQVTERMDALQSAKRAHEAIAAIAGMANSARQSRP